MKKAALSFICTVLVAQAWAQFSNTENLTMAQTQIMELRFDQAVEVLMDEEKANPDNKFIPYLRSNIAFLAQFLSNDPETLDSTLAFISDQLRLVEKSKDKKSPYYHYCLAEINFELGALQLQNGSNWKAAWSMLEALDQIQENKKVSADFLPQQFMDGILNVTMGSLPKRYKVMARLLGYSGDVETGIALMDQSTKTENTPYQGFKKKFVFAYGYTRSVLYENDSVNVWDLDSNYTTSPLLLYIQARIYQNQGKNEALITMIEETEFEQRFPFVYIDYMLGKAKLNRLDKDADVLFIAFIDNYEGMNSLKAANRYLSWFCFLEGDKGKSDSYRQKVFTEGESSIGADQMALFDASLEYNERLIKARLLFDGGYYQEALDQLNFDVATLKNSDLKMEYYYRQGRILQKLGNVKGSATSFENVFSFKDSDAKRYFAANAALQLALLYEENGQNQMAVSKFEHVMTFEDFPFEDGTHQKAKAGLQRLEN